MGGELTIWLRRFSAANPPARGSSSWPSAPRARVHDVGRSTRTSCGRSRTSSTARSSPRTQRIIVGPMVTNPATRDRTVTASLFATLNEMFGNRTICGIGRGDSAVRVTNGPPHAGRGRGGDRTSSAELANCRPSTTRAATLRFPWARTCRWRCGLPRTGRRRSRSPARSATGSSSSSPTPTSPRWTIARGARGRGGGGPGPRRDHVCVAAPAYSATTCAHMREQCRWFGGMVGNHVADIVDRYGEGGDGARAR